MAEPTDYERSYSFTGFQTGNPTSPLPGDELDNELDNIATAVGATQSALANIRRSDGKLQNNIVTADSVTDDFLEAVIGLAKGALSEIDGFGPDLTHFSSVWLGASATNPTSGPGGAPLTAGMMYYNTATTEYRVYDGTTWQFHTAVSQVDTYFFTATANQQNFYGTDAAGKTVAVVPGALLVSINGVGPLREGTDFAVRPEGNGIDLAEDCAAGDEVMITSFRQLQFSQVGADVASDADRAESARDDARAARDAAAAARDEAQLYDGVKVDVATDLSALTSAEVSVGDYVRVIQTTDVYRRAPDNAINHDRVSGSLKYYAQPFPAEYVDRHFGITADGTTDDTAAFLRAAANIPTGKTLRLVGAGSRIIGSKVTFEQDRLRIVCEPGAEVKQKSGTLTMDTMIEIAGDYSAVVGGIFNGNLAGNSGSYTGRGELIRVTGDHCTMDGVEIDGTQDVPHATGVYWTGDYAILRNITTRNTGLNAIRSWVKHIDVDGLRMYGIYGANAHGFAQDGDAGHILKRAILRNIYAQSSAAIAVEAVLFDNDGNQGGSVLVDGLTLDFPNMTGPDAFKFAYVDDVTVRGLRGAHAEVANYRTTLRLQQGVAKLTLDDCIFSGGVNFDASVDCDMRVMGGTIFGAAFDVAAGIEDFQGVMTVEDGCAFRNCRTAAITTASTAYDAKGHIGRVHLHGAAGFSPNLWKSSAHSTAGTKRRLAAGHITVREPLSITGTFKSRAANGVWIGLSETQDATCAQVGDRGFAVGGSDYPPRDSEGWRLGDTLVNRSAAAGATPAEYRCTTAGAACNTAWAGSTAYALGAWVYNGSNVYACVTAGTSASSGGPTGTGTGITDGTCVWDRVDTLAVFKGIGSISA